MTIRAVTPRDWLHKFGAALERGDINAAAGLFEPGGFWRDLMRACEMLECPARMPLLVSQYRAARQRVGTQA